MTNDLRKKIDYSIALLRKAEALALRFDPDDGFYLAFSGGKDSQALLHLSQMGSGNNLLRKALQVSQYRPPSCRTMA